MTDGDAVAAQKLVDELLTMAWAARNEFVYQHESLDDAIYRARVMATELPGDKPVILLDHYDNTARKPPWLQLEKLLCCSPRVSMPLLAV
eukprot:SAG31_NODE_1467_length_8227_cov_7.040108_9_plen_90_part_00